MFYHRGAPVQIALADAAVLVVAGARSSGAHAAPYGAHH